MGKKTQIRAKQILDLLLREGKRNVEDLVQELGISPASVRRDLVALEARGLVRRSYGGVELAGKLMFEAFQFDAAFPLREGRFAQEKGRIALAAIERVKEGDTIALGPGTTTTQVARGLRQHQGIHVVTTAMNIGMELGSAPNLQLTLTGGSVRWPGAFSMVGISTLENLEQFFFDVAIVGVCGIHPDRGVTVIQPDEASVLRRMFTQSQRKIVVADSSKVGVSSPARICSMSEVNTVITDSNADERVVDALRRQQVEVILV